MTSNLKIICLALLICLIFAVDCDADYSCQTDYTCCKTSSDEWACCQYRNAVCCSKYDTCCRAGSVCSPKGCLNAFTSNAIFEDSSSLFPSQIVKQTI